MQPSEQGSELKRLRPRLLGSPDAICAIKLVVHLQVVTREPFAADWYVLSSIQPDLEEASSVNKTLDPGVFVDTVEGVVSPPR